MRETADGIKETIDSIKQVLSNHETRLVVLEKQKEGDWKEQLLMLLGKAIIIGLISIGTLTGAGGLITKILGL